MLEKMRESTAARRIVLRSDTIPHLNCGGRRGVILNRDNAEAIPKRAVGEREGRNANIGCTGNTAMSKTNMSERIRFTERDLLLAI
jgi:hypothetical protein